MNDFPGQNWQTMDDQAVLSALDSIYLGMRHFQQVHDFPVTQISLPVDAYRRLRIMAETGARRTVGRMCIHCCRGNHDLCKGRLCGCRFLSSRNRDRHRDEGRRA